MISDGMNARVGSLTADRECFMPWRTIRDENDRPLLEFELEKVVRGFFAPELLLDYLRYFVLFEQGDDALIKKIAGYHQFHAVREAVRVTVIAATKPQNGADRDEERATYGKEVMPGLAQGRHRLAHAGLGQEHLHGLLRGEAHAAAGDAEPDAGRGDGSQRSRRAALSDIHGRRGLCSRKRRSRPKTASSSGRCWQGGLRAGSSSPRSRSSRRR